MAVILGASIFLSIILAVSVNFNSIDQAHLPSLFNGMTDSATLDYLANFNENYETPIAHSNMELFMEL